MAKRLVDDYGEARVVALSQRIAAVYPAFDPAAFQRQAMDGFEALGLMDRGRQLSRCLHAQLPADPVHALTLLRQSWAQLTPSDEPSGFNAFQFLPDSFYIADYALDWPAEALETQYFLTQRFTSEFCLRPFIQRWPVEVYAKLNAWVEDENEHVRRLVSEATRPRLPWASRLPVLIEDPATPVRACLEALRDDPSAYVRRSVANHLNDWSKTHPESMLTLVEDWWSDAPPARQQLLRHALRSLLKSAHPRALALLGHEPDADLELQHASLTPQTCAANTCLTLSATLHARQATPTAPLVYLVLSFKRRKPGAFYRKPFRLACPPLAANQTLTLTYQHRFKPLTTRRHYAGEQQAALLINGQTYPLGSFWLAEDF